MVGYMPKEVREGLEAARKREQRKRGRMRLEVGGESFTVLRYWETGLAVDAENAAHLRGLADLYDGGRHVAQCLIVASEEDGDEVVFEFKRQTAAGRPAPCRFRARRGGAGRVPAASRLTFAPPPGRRLAG